jgi:hypothetical protein
VLGGWGIRKNASPVLKASGDDPLHPAPLLLVSRCPHAFMCPRRNALVSSIVAARQNLTVKLHMFL